MGIGKADWGTQGLTWKAAEEVGTAERTVVRIGTAGQLETVDQIVGKTEMAEAEQLELVDQTVEQIEMAEKVAEESGLGWPEAIAAVLAGLKETVVGQLGLSQGMVEQIGMEAVGKPGLRLGRRKLAAKTAEVFQPGRGTVERQLPGWGIVVVPGSGTVAV